MPSPSRVPDLPIVAAQLNTSTGETRILGPFVNHEAFLDYLELLAEAWGLSRDGNTLVDASGRTLHRHVTCSPVDTMKSESTPSQLREAVAVFAVTAITGEPFLAAVCSSQSEAEQVVSIMKSSADTSEKELALAGCPDISEYILASFERPSDPRAFSADERSALIHVLRSERLD